MSDKFKRHILAIRTASAAVEGLGPGVYSSLRVFDEVAEYWWGPRGVLENDPRWLQIIPYIVIKHNDSVLAYERTAAGGEERLHGQHSIGVGGHVEMEDYVPDAHNQMSLPAVLQRAAYRELAEELNCAVGELWFPGFCIYNPAEAVGKVHLGIVGVLEVDSPEDISNAADDLRSVRFVHRDEVKSLPNLEAWSSLLVPHLHEM